MNDQSRLQRALRSGGLPMLAAAVASLRDAVVELNPGLLPHDDWAKALSRDLDEREEQVHPIARAHVTRRTRPEITIQDDDGEPVPTNQCAACGANYFNFCPNCTKAEEDEPAHPAPASRSEQKRPPPPDELVGALHDPVHPSSGDLIASKPVHQGSASLLDGLRDAKAEATTRLQEKVDANPSGFIRPAPASPPGGEGPVLLSAANARVIALEQERDTLRAEVNRLNAEAFELKRKSARELTAICVACEFVRRAQNDWSSADTTDAFLALVKAIDDVDRQ